MVGTDDLNNTGYFFFFSVNITNLPVVHIETLKPYHTTQLLLVYCLTLYSKYLMSVFIASTRIWALWDQRPASWFFLILHGIVISGEKLVRYIFCIMLAVWLHNKAFFYLLKKLNIVKNKTEKELILLAILSDCFWNHGRKKYMELKLFSSSLVSTGFIKLRA